MINFPYVRMFFLYVFKFTVVTRPRFSGTVPVFGVCPGFTALWKQPANTSLLIVWLWLLSPAEALWATGQWLWRSCREQSAIIINHPKRRCYWFQGNVSHILTIHVKTKLFVCSALYKKHDKVAGLFCTQY